MIKAPRKPTSFSAVYNIATLLGIFVLFSAIWLSAVGWIEIFPLLRQHAIYLSILTVGLVWAVRFARFSRLSVLVLISVATLFLMIFIIDLTFLRFFKEPFYRIYPHLPVKAGTASLQSVIGYSHAYISFGSVLLASLAIGSAFFIASQRKTSSRDLQVDSLTFLPAVFLIGWFGATEGDAVGMADIMGEPPIVSRPFITTNRASSVLSSGPTLLQPKTIVFVIMESTGRSVPSSGGQRTLREELISLGGSADWIDFNNAVTNSNATDVSIPSMLTGVGPNESMDKLQSMPFLMDMAKARNYQTALITSSTLNWASFDKLFDGAQLDLKVFAEKSGLPFINDLTVDDLFAFQSAADLIRRAPDKLFVTLYSNALHWPFQQKSAIPIPDSISDPRTRAAYIQERGFMLLFDALRDSGRMDDSLIIVVGDHGEFDYRGKTIVPVTRVETFEGGILSPLFILKLPSDFPGSLRAVVNSNRDALVSSVDFAPTLAQLLGLRLANGLSYQGYSVIEKVPYDRIALSTSTNEWRSWTKSAIAVSRGKERLTCEPYKLCKLQIQTVDGMRFLRQAQPIDELFKIAVSDATLRKNIGQIYRENLKVK